MTAPVRQPMVAVMGGTFDPIHNGHLRAAWESHRAMNAEVRLMPANVPPHRAQPLASAQQRLDMLRIAIAGKPGLAVDDRELHRAGPSYSVDTLIELRSELGATRPLALILGADAFAGLPSWHRWLQLFELAHIVVLTRPGAATIEDWSPELRAQVEQRRAASVAELAMSAAGRVYALAITPLAISSTAVRASLASGDRPYWLVPDQVLAFIDRENLYRP